MAEGEIDAVTILSRKLIDTHYYAIANKASLSKPVELNPPAAKLSEFTAKFGLTWSQVSSLVHVALCLACIWHLVACMVCVPLVYGLVGAQLVGSQLGTPSLRSSAMRIHMPTRPCPWNACARRPPRQSRRLVHADACRSRRVIHARAQALAEGVVYNAVDACDVMGVDADELDAHWALAKASAYAPPHRARVRWRRLRGPALTLTPTHTLTLTQGFA